MCCFHIAMLAMFKLCLTIKFYSAHRNSGSFWTKTRTSWTSLVQDAPAVSGPKVPHTGEYGNASTRTVPQPNCKLRFPAQSLGKIRGDIHTSLCRTSKRCDPGSSKHELPLLSLSSGQYLPHKRPRYGSPATDHRVLNWAPVFSSFPLTGMFSS